MELTAGVLFGFLLAVGLWSRGLFLWKTPEVERLRREKAKLQAIWVTVVMSCTPPDDCNDPVVLKRYMKACLDKANEYEKEYPK